MIGMSNRRLADIRQRSSGSGGWRVPGIGAKIARQGEIERPARRAFSPFRRSQSGSKKGAEQDGENCTLHDHSRLSSQFAWEPVGLWSSIFSRRFQSQTGSLVSILRILVLRCGQSFTDM